MSAVADHNPAPFTLTDSDVRLAPAPRHFPTRTRQELELKEQTQETLSRTESTSIAESIAYPSLNREDQAKIPFKHVAKTSHKKRRICLRNPLFAPPKTNPARYALRLESSQAMVFAVVDVDGAGFGGQDSVGAGELAL